MTKFLITFFVSLFILFSARADADVYLITDIEVDVTAANSSAARLQAFSQARTAGARRLINRLTARQDREAAQGLNITYDVANRLSTAVDVQTEKASGTRYIGLLSVKFDPRAVRAYLDAYNVPFVDGQAVKALIIPSSSLPVVSNEWSALWSGLSSDDTLAPWVGSTALYSSRTNWSQIQAEVATVSATRGIQADISGDIGQFYVTLSELSRFNPTARRIGVTGPHATLESAKSTSIRYLEEDWKALTLVRAVGETRVNAVARFNDRKGWISIEKALNGSQLVKNVRVSAISAFGADLEFVYSGRPDQLTTELRARGVNLTSEIDGLLLSPMLPR